MAQQERSQVANGAPRAGQRPSTWIARGNPRQRNNGERDSSDVKCQKMSMLFKSTEFNMLANKTVVEERVWVRPGNTGLMGASGIAPMLGMIETPDMRLKDARMANGASVLDHWRTSHPTVEVNPDQFMVREMSSGVMIPVQFLKVVQLPKCWSRQRRREDAIAKEGAAHLHTTPRHHHHHPPTQPSSTTNAPTTVQQQQFFK
ncbi:hypothetical protein B9Z55_002745 [Caenorhabditis nigoni]|nr:hypothetical protein B9Z55_002745 [Caenorhabditis nigoni]